MNQLLVIALALGITTAGMVNCSFPTEEEEEVIIEETLEERVRKAELIPGVVIEKGFNNEVVITTKHYGLTYVINVIEGGLSMNREKIETDEYGIPNKVHYNVHLPSEISISDISFAPPSSINNSVMIGEEAQELYIKDVKGVKEISGNQIITVLELGRNTNKGYVLNVGKDGNLYRLKGDLISNEGGINKYLVKEGTSIEVYNDNTGEFEKAKEVDGGELFKYVNSSISKASFKPSQNNLFGFEGDFPSWRNQSSQYTQSAKPLAPSKAQGKWNNTKVAIPPYFQNKGRQYGRG